MIASLPVALALEGVRALVLGGDDEAADKAQRLLGAGARVTVFAETVVPALSALAARGALHWHARAYVPRDARGARVVVLATQDEGLASELRAQGRRDGFWLSAIDQPAHCDFVWVSVAQAGPVQLALSSGGAAPALVQRLREELARLLDPRFAAFAYRLADARLGLRGLSRDARRARMAALLRGFSVEAQVHYPPWEAAPDGEAALAPVDPRS